MRKAVLTLKENEAILQKSGIANETIVGWKNILERTAENRPTLKSEYMKLLIALKQDPSQMNVVKLRLFEEHHRLVAYDMTKFNEDCYSYFRTLFDQMRDDMMSVVSDIGVNNNNAFKKSNYAVKILTYIVGTNMLQKIKSFLKKLNPKLSAIVKAFNLEIKRYNQILFQVKPALAEVKEADVRKLDSEFWSGFASSLAPGSIQMIDAYNKQCRAEEEILMLKQEVDYAVEYYCYEIFHLKQDIELLDTGIEWNRAFKSLLIKKVIEIEKLECQMKDLQLLFNGEDTDDSASGSRYETIRQFMNEFNAPLSDEEIVSSDDESEH